MRARSGDLMVGRRDGRARAAAGHRSYGLELLNLFPSGGASDRGERRPRPRSQSSAMQPNRAGSVFEALASSTVTVPLRLKA